MDYSVLPICFDGIYACKVDREVCRKIGIDDYDQVQPTKMNRIWGVTSGKKIDQPIYTGIRFIDIEVVLVKSELFEGEIFSNLTQIRKNRISKSNPNNLVVESIEENWLFAQSENLDLECYFVNQHSIKASYFNKDQKSEFDLNLQFISW